MRDQLTEQQQSMKICETFYGLVADEASANQGYAEALQMDGLTYEEATALRLYMSEEIAHNLGIQALIKKRTGMNADAHIAADALNVLAEGVVV